MGSFIDQLIINELSREMDSYIRSAYFYKDRDTKILAGPLWDYDLSFGVGGFFQNDQTAGWQYQQVRQPLANDWYTQLMRDPAFVNEVRLRWQTLRRGPLSDASLQSRINALTGPLTNGAQRNFQRWPNLSTRMVGPFITPTAPTWQGRSSSCGTGCCAAPRGWTRPPAGAGPRLPRPPPRRRPPTTPPPHAATHHAAAEHAAADDHAARRRRLHRDVHGDQPVVRRFPGRGTGHRGRRGDQWLDRDLDVPGRQTVTQAWNATVTSQGSAVTARNVSYNGSLAAGASTSFGFLGSTTGTPSTPTPTCTAS